MTGSISNSQHKSKEPENLEAHGGGKPATELRRGWTTGACATAATKAALVALLKGEFPDPVTIKLPKGDEPSFALALEKLDSDSASAGIIKDAGDDPDVTHGAMIISKVALLEKDAGIRFVAGEGVGTVTKPGLPIDVGEAAINPVPRQLMTEVVNELDVKDVQIEISIPEGEALAQKTWNPRLGIVGGLSILGTTGVVHPFSCSAWIHSIHRGIDVARAEGLEHVAGCTGSTSEKTVQEHFELPDHAMLDMGDFAGGLLKYLRKNPVPRLTIGGGFAKMVKLAEGHLDLHSGRSQVSFDWLAGLAESETLRVKVKSANTAKEAYELARDAGEDLAAPVAAAARQSAIAALRGAPVEVDLMVMDRQGKVIAHAR